MNPTSSRLNGAVVTLAVVLAFGRSLAAADAGVTRVTMLPLSDRSTLVIEFSAPVSNLVEVEGTSNRVTLEAGPLKSAVSPARLAPTTASRLVSEVTVGGTTRPDGTHYLRLSIAMPSPAVHRQRLSGSRLYVDLVSPSATTAAVRNAPTPAPQPARDEAGPASKPARAPQPTRAPDEGGPPTAPPSPSEKSSPAPGETPTDAAYRILESTTLSRARQMAAHPDVKGLLRLRDEVEARDNALGHRQPELISRLVTEILKYTDQARALQLEEDRRTFEK